MKNVLLMCAVLFAFGCGPRGLPVSDVSSYQLDYYDYVQNRLPVMEKIVDGQCEVRLDLSPLFEDERHKAGFMEGLGLCSNRITALLRHVERFKLIAMLERNEAVEALRVENEENIRRFIRVDQLVSTLKKMEARLDAKYEICNALHTCLGNSGSESDTTRCLEETAARLLKVLPKE